MFNTHLIHGAMRRSATLCSVSRLGPSRLNQGSLAMSSIGAIRTFSKPARDIEPVFSPKAVNPIKANGFVFLAGQIPAEPTGKLIEGSVTEKAHKMCQNARAVLEAAGSSLENVVKVTIYFQNFDDFKEVNDVYQQYFPQKPARSSCECPRLPAGASIEMDLIALQ